MKNKTILLYGGSFNPITTLHTHILRKTFEKLNENETLVDEAWLLPSGQNPFKSVEGMADYADRVNMCKLAISNLSDNFKVSEFEGTLSPPFETFTVLKALRNTYPHYLFVWLMGSDNFLHFHTWDKWEEILEHHPIVGVLRDCSDDKIYTCEMMREFEKFIYLENSRFLVTPNLRVIDIGLHSGSATDIRNAIRTGSKIKNIHKSVIYYIESKALYR